MLWDVETLIRNEVKMDKQICALAAGDKKEWWQILAWVKFMDCKMHCGQPYEFEFGIINMVSWLDAAAVTSAN